MTEEKNLPTGCDGEEVGDDAPATGRRASLLSTLDCGGRKVGEVYWISGRPGEPERIEPFGTEHQRHIIEVRVLEVGDDYVVEECSVRTQYWERGVAYGFHTVAPPGAGWTQDTSFDHDRWTHWRRRRSVSP